VNEIMSVGTSNREAANTISDTEAVISIEKMLADILSRPRMKLMPRARMSTEMTLNTIIASISRVQVRVAIQIPILRVMNRKAIKPKTASRPGRVDVRFATIVQFHTKWARTYPSGSRAGANGM